jgi:archaellum biogenesis ATPase FlaH
MKFNPQKLEVIGGKREYVLPQTEVLPLTEKAFQYLTETRKLYPDTLKAYRLGCNKRGEIILPFYDENDKYVLAKFRGADGNKIQRKRKTDNGFDIYDTKTAIEPKGKPVLFGSHLCEASEGSLVIAFGDYDAMTLSQQGIPNCVSLPFGDSGFDFIDIQWEFLQKFNEIILFPDNDKYPNPDAELRAKKKLDELANRLGKHRVRLVNREYLGEAKDPNEHLIKYGEQSGLLDAVVNAEWFPSGIVTVADYIEDVVNEGIPFGYPELDRITGGACDGHLIVISGDNGAGKTTFTLNVVANFVEEQQPVFLWSGEQKVGKIRYWFERITAGDVRKYTSPKTFFESYYPLDEDLPKIREWYRDYLFQLADVHLTPEQFFATAEIAIRRHGCRLVIVDNLMAFTGGEGEGYYQAQGDFAENCKRFAEKWNVPVILIVHNKKEEMNGQLKLPNKNSVEGSKKITNWADTVLQMFRIPDIYQANFEGADSLVIVCKSRESGILDAVKLMFNSDSARFTQKDFEFRSFGWRYL